MLNRRILRIKAFKVLFSYAENPSMTLKEAEYVTAARALGASSGRIIKKHLLTNCIGTLIVTTTLQIPSSLFTELPEAEIM